MKRPISNWPQSEIETQLFLKRFNSWMDNGMETNAFGIKL